MIDRHQPYRIPVDRDCTYVGLVWANVNMPSIKAEISLVFRDKGGGDEL